MLGKMRPRSSGFDYTPAIALLVIAIPIIVLAAYSITNAPPPLQNQITIQPNGPNRFMFRPSSLTVHVGEETTWVNHVEFPVAVISDNATDPFDSGSIGVGMSYEHTFNNVGIFQYHSSIPDLTGTIIVVS
jgi:plastocyanin